MRATLPPIIGPSRELQQAIRAANEKLPVTYEVAKRQVDRIQAIMTGRSLRMAKQGRIGS